METLRLGKKLVVIHAVWNLILKGTLYTIPLQVICHIHLKYACLIRRVNIIQYFPVSIHLNMQIWFICETFVKCHRKENACSYFAINSIIKWRNKDATYFTPYQFEKNSEIWLD